MSASSYSIPDRRAIQLAIETTGHTGSIAILRGESVLEDVGLPSGCRTAATLSPALGEAIRWCRSRQLEPSFVSVALGPGSFTGLRIGVTTAKTLCYATGWPLVAVDSLAAIAASALSSRPAEEAAGGDHVLVGVNAYRRQVFSGRFSRVQLLPPLESLPPPGRREAGGGLGATGSPAGLGAAGSLEQLEVEVLSAAAWQQRLQRLPAETLLAGDEKLFGDSAGDRFVRRSTRDAVGVGLLGVRAALAGRWVDPLALVPRYLKPSAAEEKAAR